METDKNKLNKVIELIKNETASVCDFAWCYYHVFNWHILPGYKGQKHSYLSWKKDGFIDKRYEWNFLEKKFDEPDVTNILLVTGKVSDITVVDFDSKKTVSEKAKFLIEELPRTLTSITGSGGKHFFYKFLKEFQDLIGIEKCIDIRNDGLIVLPPSIHKNGNKYEWEDINDYLK